MKHLPTLRQLRYLVTVAELGHFGRAAEACAVTQSTLSAGVREMENLLGVALLDRGHRVVLTPLGEEIVARAREVLRAAEDLVDAATAGSQPLTGLFRLGVIPTIAPYLLPRAMPAVRRDYPDLRLYLREAQTHRLLDLLGQGRLDAALIALPYDVSGFETAHLGRDRLMVACRRDHPFAAADAVDEESLRDAPLLMLEDGHCLRDHALTACRFGTRHANEVFQATSMGTLLQMVAAGMGVTLIPEMAVATEVDRTPDLVARPLTGDRGERRITLCWRKGSARSREMRLLAGLLAATDHATGDPR